MAKRGRVQLGLVSLVMAVAGGSGLAACGSDSSDGDKAGSAGASADSGAGGAHAGSVNKAGGGGATHAVASGSGEAGTSMAGDSAAGAAGSDGGMGGEAGAAPTVIPPELKALSPLPPLPADPTNKYAENAEAAVLGQQLFFDKRYSGPLKIAGELGNLGETGKVACATCHLGGAMSDGRDPFNVTKGTDLHTRNAPALVNSSFYEWTNWGGRFAAQWELPLAVAENPRTMNSSRLQLAHFIYDNYKSPYEAVFGALPAALDASSPDAAHFPATGKPGDAAAWDTIMTGDDKTAVNRIIVNYGKAIQAYMRKLVSRNAAFDQYVENGGGNLSQSAIRGSLLFVGKAKCSVCHSGPFFSDNQFHNLGVPVAMNGGVPVPDDGRFSDAGSLKASPINIDSAFSDKQDTGRLASLATLDPTLHAAFRTSSLREVKDTAPYMHAGQFATLAAVVSFYNAGGGEPVAGSTKDPLLTPLSLSDTEQADLVEFLKTLSGEPVPSSLLTAP